MLFMSDVKIFNLVKEHEGDLHNVWRALFEDDTIPTRNG